MWGGGDVEMQAPFQKPGGSEVVLDGRGAGGVWAAGVVVVGGGGGEAAVVMVGVLRGGVQGAGACGGG